jgi:protein-S-isoprenylcysteine O-methyltransferase Ste14
LDNKNLRAELLEALGDAMDLIDEAAALLQAGKVKDASDKIHDARQKVNLVGDRHRELGAPPHMNRLAAPILIAIGVVCGVAAAGLFARGINPAAWPYRDDLRRMLPAQLLYVAFALYWTVAARDSAPADKSESKGSTTLHQSLLSIAQILLLVPGLTGHYLPKTPLFLAFGLAIETASIALAVWARRHLGHNWSAEVRIAVGHQLVRTGPYRFTRHPIYVAMLGIFVGAAIVSGQYSGLVAVVMLALLYVRKIRLEEQALSNAFGDEWDAYRRGGV